MGRHSKSTDVVAKSRRVGFARLFFRDRSGSTAIEFAALALPFSMLVFAILETCISFAGQEVLANATDDVARQLRTGQVKAAQVTETKIKGMICDQLQVMVSNDCTNQLMIDLRKYDSFQKASLARFKIVSGQIQLTNNNANDSFAITPGKSGTINMLRVFYKWPVITDFMSKWLANLANGRTLHFASVTWQNEPFDD